MKGIILNNVKRIAFGPGCLNDLAKNFLVLGLNRLYIITIPTVLKQISPLIKKLKSQGITIQTNLSIEREPSIIDFEKVLKEAKAFKAESIAGIGGGSVMDVAKLVAAQINNSQTLESIIGNGLLRDRKTLLICIPTTSGTGSEVSPNSILTDKDGSKKAVISPYLVPDMVYIDPKLTLSLPPTVTAYTSLDALTHCIEAYTNKYAHPIVDQWALEGIKLISSNLLKVLKNGNDIEARTSISLGSMYGGMCLGPVNTTAVHALAYPLGTDFKIAHGLSNALLLPYVMEFNQTAAPKRYAEVALALGAKKYKSDLETAKAGITKVKKLLRDCNIPSKLSALGVSKNDIVKMAKSAMEIQRLLKNNVRKVSLKDAIAIYKTAC
jgi:alcohol dehydrogenase